MTLATGQQRNSDLVGILGAEFQRRGEPNFAWRTAVSAGLLLPSLRAFWPGSVTDSGGGVGDLTGNTLSLTNNNTVTRLTINLAPCLNFVAASSQYLSETATGTGYAPDAATYVLQQAWVGAGLPNIRIATAGTGITITDAGAGGALTWAVDYAALDGRYLKLDGSNDPVTGTIDINITSATAFRVQVTGGATYLFKLDTISNIGYLSSNGTAGSTATLLSLYNADAAKNDLDITGDIGPSSVAASFRTQLEIRNKTTLTNVAIGFSNLTDQLCQMYGVGELGTLKGSWNVKCRDWDGNWSQVIATAGDNGTKAYVWLTPGTNGRVAVNYGTGTPPTYTLDVNGSIRANTNLVGNESGTDSDSKIEGENDVNLTYWDASTDRVGIGTATPATKEHVLLTDGGTAAVVDVRTTGHDSTGTPAAGFGAGQVVKLESSTTAEQEAYRQDVLWTVATHASRNALLRGNTLPAGSVVGYHGFWAGTGVDGTAQTAILNATGDVVETITLLYAGSEITGTGTFGGVVNLEPGDSWIVYDDGTDALTLAVAADGSVTAQRTAGADTFKVVLWMVWL